jgi:hypothetical protein
MQQVIPASQVAGPSAPYVTGLLEPRGPRGQIPNESVVSGFHRRDRAGGAHHRPGPDIVSVVSVVEDIIPMLWNGRCTMLQVQNGQAALQQLECMDHRKCHELQSPKAKVQTKHEEGQEAAARPRWANQGWSQSQSEREGARDYELT